MAEAIKQIEKSNIDLEPEVLDTLSVRELLSLYARAKKLVSYGETMLAASSATRGGGAHNRGVPGQGEGRGGHRKLLEVGRRGSRRVQIGRALLRSGSGDRRS